MSGKSSTLKGPASPTADPAEEKSKISFSGPRVRVDARPDVPAEKLLERQPYWVGTLPGAPLFCWTCPGSGVRFVRNTGGMDEKGNYTGPKGQVVQLTEDQVRLTVENVRNHVVRFDGPPSPHGRRARIWPVKYFQYRAKVGDEPIGHYLYMYKLDPEAPHNRPTMSPEPMFDAATAE